MNDRLEKLSTLYRAHITVLKLRFDQALAETRYDNVVIFSGAEHYQFLDDMPYPFKVNPLFKYWVPVLNNPHCFVVYEPGVKPKLVYYQPVDYWHKPAATPSGWWVPPFDIHVVATPEEAKAFFPKGRTAFLGEWNESFSGWGKLTANPEDLLNRIHFERAGKTEYEIECVRIANEAGAAGHIAAENAFRQGASGYEINLAYLRAANQTTDELPYGNIIALNEDAAVLHNYHHDRNRLPESERHSFLIDAGASFNGYACDITRTYSARNDEFAQLVAAMDTMQLELCAVVQPKMNYPEFHLLTHRKIAQILVDFGFVSGLDADGVVSTRVSSAFLPHGVGHLIGLQTHDVGGFMADPTGKTIPKPEGHPYLRLTRSVEPTWIFTIEPGLYFIEPLLADLQKSDSSKYVNWPKVDAFRKFGGIRIEDDVVVTDNGHENLTRQAFAQSPR